jgi:hypothetical protein
MSQKTAKVGHRRGRWLRAVLRRFIARRAVGLADVVARLPEEFPVTLADRRLFVFRRDEYSRNARQPRYVVQEIEVAGDAEREVPRGEVVPYDMETPPGRDAMETSRGRRPSHSQVLWAAAWPDGEVVGGFVSIGTAIKALVWLGDGDRVPARRGRWRVAVPETIRPSRLTWVIYTLLWGGYALVLGEVIRHAGPGPGRSEWYLALLGLGGALWLGKRLSANGRLLTSRRPVILRTQHLASTRRFGRLLARTSSLGLLALYAADVFYGYHIYHHPGLTVAMIYVIAGGRGVSLLRDVGLELSDRWESDWRWLLWPTVLITLAPVATAITLVPYGHQIERATWQVLSWVPLGAVHVFHGWVGTNWFAVPASIPLWLIWLWLVGLAAAAIRKLVDKIFGSGSDLADWLKDTFTLVGTGR